MTKWKAGVTPKYGLMLKYLRMILSEAELKDLLKRYVEAKKVELANHPDKRKHKIK